MRFWFQGGWKEKKKSVAVLLENLHLKKSSDHERLSGRDLAPCTPASLAEKSVLPVWAVEGGHCVGVQYMLWSQSHYQSTHLNLIFFFFFLALFYDNKGCTRSRSHVSEPLFCLCFFCAAAFISFRSELLVYYTLNKRAGRTESVQRMAVHLKGKWLLLNSVLGWKTTRLLREI